MDTVDIKVSDFFKKGKHQIYKKGEILIRADEDPPGVFYLTSGTVKEYTVSKKGEELVVNIFKPNAFFPMSWAINNTENNYYYEAVGDVEVYRSGKSEVLIFIKENQDVLLDLLGRVYRGTDGLISRMVYMMSENARDRLIIELLIHAKRFGKVEEDQSIVVETSEKDIAARSGMTRETVSREMKKLKDKNLVEFKNNILVVMDINRLEEELVVTTY